VERCCEGDGDGIGPAADSLSQEEADNDVQVGDWSDTVSVVLGA